VLLPHSSVKAFEDEAYIHDKFILVLITS
jgi:hypothetical protein